MTNMKNIENQISKTHTNETLPKDLGYNLSDFAFFLSVMKYKKAYRSVLSIVLNEPDIKLKEVKVEQVILNKSGKRAIRLDAWAVSEDHRQFNMEMENHSEQDSVAKRARYYQGLIDTPILKSGKHTKYKHLPATVIIFITQEDIFKKDLAKYTFCERCEEIPELKLDDGTTKIFLNMSSKNGSKELVSLLQYMKNTDLNNPEVEVKDERLLELDRVVTEVREVEEWEDMRMTILDYGIEEGIRRGRAAAEAEAKEKSIKSTIEICKEFNADRECTMNKIVEKFSLTEEDAGKYMDLYW